uniref:Uncharacterized protein n=1 Tax=Russula virescens TaxID=71688 RepID=A0A2S0U3Z6_9AGAM|nr:hypothetical protein [Russula virescens]AWB36221.1 hypothetical protein [Russula virescens]
MQNLNKYTKADLISRIKKLDNQTSNLNNTNSFLHKIVDSILTFKSLILKVTLIAFVIKWIKKYSFVQKLWRMFGWIASTVLGISLIDIYAIDLITWIKDTSIYKWYSEFFSPKTEIIKEKSKDEFQFPKGITNKTIENETETDETNRISDWITRRNQEKEVENNNAGYWTDYKHIIIISGIIIGTIVIYYYHDEITEGFSSCYEWIKNQFSRPPRDPGDNNTENISTSTTQSNEQNRKKGFWKYFGIESEDFKGKGKDISNERLSIKSEPVILENKLEGSSKLTDSKTILTSPSIENLTNQTEEAWSQSSSPKSDDSSVTAVAKSLALTPASLSIEEVTDLTTNWSNILNYKGQEAMKFIDETYKSNSELTPELQDNLINSLAIAINEYDQTVKIYNTILQDEITKLKMRISLFGFRQWLRNVHALTVPNDTMLDIGTNNDIPTNLKDLLKR